MGGIRWVLVSRLLLAAEPPGCAPDLWAIVGELPSAPSSGKAEH